MLKKALTESGIAILAALAQKGIYPGEDAIIAFNFEEGEDEGYITVNYVATNVRFKVSDLSKGALEADGMKWWPTWSFYEK